MQAIIVGAGFSRHAGVPLQSEFTKALLAARKYRLEKPSRILIEYLSEFVHDVFGHSTNAKACFWPDLEDLFTCVDLAANTGHHLGPKYCPAELRTIRRSVIARIIRMLTEQYKKAQETDAQRFKHLQRLISSLDLRRTAFISLNWDVVIEDLLSKRAPDVEVRYGAGGQHADLDSSADGSVVLKRSTGTPSDLVKIHGSINWLYCDNCRRLLSFPPSRVLRIADQMLSSEDWSRISDRTGMPPSAGQHPKLRCPYCPDVSLGTRIATFSYRKALDFPMFQRSWDRAEKLLRRADRWAFIGYSLPAADYEFKYLLKRVQLARNKSPEIIIVTGGGRAAARRTYENYQRFFGAGVSKQRLFTEGINSEVVAILCEPRDSVHSSLAASAGGR